MNTTDWVIDHNYPDNSEYNIYNTAGFEKRKKKAAGLSRIWSGFDYGPVGPGNL
jgi:hypothetical protein